MVSRLTKENVYNLVRSGEDDVKDSPTVERYQKSFRYVYSLIKSLSYDKLRQLLKAPKCAIPAVNRKQAQLELTLEGNLLS
jgi:hypothetical protein